MANAISIPQYAGILNEGTVCSAKELKRNGTIVSVFLFQAHICQALNVFLHFENISVILMAALILACLITNRHLLNQKMVIPAIVSIVMLAVLALSIYINSFAYAGRYMLFFIAYGTTAIFIMSLRFDLKRMLKVSLAISLIYLAMYFRFWRFTAKNDSAYWDLQMGVAYTLVVTAVICLVCFLYSEKIGLKKWVKFAALTELFLTAYVIGIDCGTRGAIAAVLMGGILLLVSRAGVTKRVAWITLFLTVGLMLILNLQAILTMINNALEARGIFAPAIAKSIEALKNASFSNGRDDLYRDALDSFLRSPLWGNGVGYFEMHHGGAYTHNMFLTMLVEVGLLGALPVFFLMLRFFLKTFFSRKRTEDVLFARLVFLASVPCLLFSSTYWYSNSFWLLFWLMMNSGKVKIRFR